MLAIQPLSVVTSSPIIQYLPVKYRKRPFEASAYLHPQQQPKRRRQRKQRRHVHVTSTPTKDELEVCASGLGAALACMHASAQALFARTRGARRGRDAPALC